MRTESARTEGGDSAVEGYIFPGPTPPAARRRFVGRGEDGRRDSCAVPPRKSRTKQMYIKHKGLKNRGEGKWDQYIRRQIAPKKDLRLAKSLVTLALTAGPRCARHVRTNTNKLSG